MKLIYTQLILLLLLCSSAGMLSAQNYELDLRSSQGKRIEIYVFDAQLSIKGTKSNRLQMESSGMKPLPKRAQGLRPIRKGAADNTGTGFEVREEGNKIIIKQAGQSELKCSIQLPRQANLLVEESQWNNNAFVNIEGMEGEIEVNTNQAPIDIKGARSSIVAKSTGGDINIIFAAFTQRGPSSVIATSGFVDVTIPSSTKANLRLETLSGEVFTDFEIKFNETPKKENPKKNRNCGCEEQIIDGSINGGGADLYLKAISDNIYLRKN